MELVSLATLVWAGNGSWPSSNVSCLCSIPVEHSVPQLIALPAGTNSTFQFLIKIVRGRGSNPHNPTFIATFTWMATAFGSHLR